MGGIILVLVLPIVLFRIFSNLLVGLGNTQATWSEYLWFAAKYGVVVYVYLYILRRRRAGR
ncbi:hypothetical protein [Paenibacillus terrigena]|uniref:hypothetical protein n=1 Tax=Paenibacillus terrigena TaxID=369333 RepID=UPI0012EC1CCE|nr:hypothetical protein [Paenibacillus terrigena]